MSVIAQFNQLGGKSVTRLDLNNLRTLARNEQEFAVYERITKLLESHPNIEIFEIEPIDNPIPINIGLGAPSIETLEIKYNDDKTIYSVNGKIVAEINEKGVLQWHSKRGLGTKIIAKIRKKAHQGLGAPRHSGVAKDGLDECGRLQPGYKFEGSRVIKVGEVAKRKPVVNNRKSKPSTEPKKQVQKSSTEPQKKVNFADSKLLGIEKITILWHEGTGEFDEKEYSSYESLQKDFVKIFNTSYGNNKKYQGGYTKVKIEITFVDGLKITERIDVSPDAEGDFNPTINKIENYLVSLKPLLNTIEIPTGILTLNKKYKLVFEKNNKNQKEEKVNSNEGDKFDFIFEVGYGGSYPIKSFIEFPAMQGLTNEGKNSTVENLISYRATKKALEKLQKLYPSNAYGNKHELSSKILNSATEEYKRKNKPASDYGKKRPRSKQSKALFSLNDIPYEVAYRAHTGTSFSPEKRAKSEQENYFNSLQEVYNENVVRAKKLNLENELDARFLKFKEKYLKLSLEYLQSRSGIYSTMISGASNFPVARMQKKNAVVDKKSKAVLDYFNNYQNLFYNEMKPVVIKTGSSEALIQLQEKLRKEEEAHQLTLVFNKIMRKKISNDEKEKELLKAGFSQKIIDSAKKEGFYELGSYVSSNRSARMRELKRRIKVEENIKQKSATIGNLEFPFKGGTVVKNLEINRLQILFDSIPDATLRSALKRGGLAFKWSPSNKAWQRQLNTFYSGSYSELEKLLPELSFEKKNTNSIKDDENVTKASKNVTKPTISVTKIVDSGIKVIPLSTIAIDRKRFQNRNKLNEVVLKNIVENFNETELDPLIVWEFKNKTYLLAGHHRYEALTQLKKKTAPVKYFQGSEAAAIDFAKVKSNSNRSLETPLERANLYREMFAKKSKSEVNEQAKKIEGKNANYILNLASLNPKGEVINAVESLLETTDKQNATLVEKLADWIGQARRTYDQLTNAHEREMFLFLMDKEQSKRVKTKADFLQKIYTIAGAFDFEKSNPLNLKRIQYKSEGENTYDKEYSEIKAELDKIYTEYSKLSTRLVDSSADDFISPADEQTYTIAIKRKAELKKQMQFWQGKQLNLERNKANYARGGQNQIGLFSPMPYLSNDNLAEEGTDIETIIKREFPYTSSPAPAPKTNKLMAMQFDSLPMDEGWEELMQNPAKNMKIAVWGAPKNGKTAGSLKLANYLTKFGNVLYNFADQGFNKSTQDLWISSGLSDNPKAEPSDISSTIDLEKEIATGKYNFVFIDMISDYIRTERLRPEEFKERFIKKFPNVSFILIFEVTKGGNFKGDQGWTHLVDAMFTVEDFFIENRGRYGLGQKVIWEEGFAKYNPKKYAEWKATQAEEPEQEEDELQFSDEIEKI